MRKTDRPNFDKETGLVPCIVQDNATGKVLMLGYMNSEAFEKTHLEKRVTFFSRSKKRLWTKGETSGNFLDVEEIFVDCDSDTLLLKVIPHGPVCHKGYDTCFNEANTGNWTLSHLEKVIHARKERPQTDSYTSELFAKGINRIAQKVGEEAVELVIEAKEANMVAFQDEAADLLYHLLVLLAAKGTTLAEVTERLKLRQK